MVSINRIRKSSLKRIRKGSLDEQIMKAASTLKEINGDIDIGGLASLISDEKRPRAVQLISRYLKEKYRNRIDQVKLEYSFSAPPIQLLREDFKVYGGNLYEAKKKYWTLEVSDNDFLRNITIPLKTDESVAELLGILWADCFYTGHYYAFRISGRVKDKNFYQKVVCNRIKEVFNLELAVKIENYVHKIDGRPLRYETPVVYISSKAVFSWLVNELGFPKRRDENMNLPRISFDDKNAVAFYRGIFEAMSSKFSVNNIALRDSNYGLITSLLLFGRKYFDLKPYLCDTDGVNSFRVIFNRRDQQILKSSGVIK